MRTLVVLALGLIAAVAALWLLQRRLIYLPSGAPGAAPPGWSEVTFVAADDLALGGWFREPHTDGAIVIVFNGNAGNRAHRLPVGSRLASAGHGVVLFDYRGYGGNSGTPTEAGLTEDATAVVEWVIANHPGRRVVLFGESLGGALAIRAAHEHPVAGLVLRSPFTSLADVASVHYPFLPVRWLLWDRYPSGELIGDVDAPVVVIAGSADEIVPPDQSRAIYDAARGEKSWVLIEGARHNDPALTSGDTVVSAIVELAASSS